MKFLFDASSIFVAVKRDKEEKLLGNYTIDLAIYELGNIVWKETNLFKTLKVNEAEELLEILDEILKLMKIINIEDLDKEIFEFAIQNNLTFYDASYAYTAKKMGLSLVTEDAKMRNKLKKEINTFSVYEI